MNGRMHAPGLDLIRAVAIAWVTVYHAMTFDLVPSSDPWFIGFGWMGVDLFFVLSGFLIASQLLRPWAEGRRPDYARFFTRRLLRTVPAYAAVLAIYFLIPASREREVLPSFWQFATFTENLVLDPRMPRTFSHVWSLCVEEQFYLVFPLVIALLAVRPSLRKTIALFVSMLAFGMIVRGALWLARVGETPFDASAEPMWRAYMAWIYYPTWSRLDGLLAGVATASIRAFRPLWWQRAMARANGLLVAGLAGIALSIAFFEGQIAGLWPTVFGFPLLASSIALVVAAGSDPRSAIGGRAVPGARALATIAYSLYLSQKIAFHLVTTTILPSFGATGIARLLYALLIASTMGTALYWLVDRPFLRMRDRMTGSARAA